MNSVAIAKLRPLIMYDMSRPIIFVLMLAKASYFNSDIGTHIVNVRGNNETAIHPQCQCMEILKDRYLDIDVRD